MGFVDRFLSNRKFVRFSLRSLKNGSYVIGRRITSEYGRPAHIVYIGRGGMVFARLLSDVLGVRSLTGINASYYLGVDRRARSVNIGEVPMMDKERGYILLVDDIADTGKTLKEVSERLRRGGKRRIVTCTVFFKPRSIVKPDLYLHEVGNDKWIVFEYEENEFRGSIK